MLKSSHSHVVVEALPDCAVNAQTIGMFKSLINGDDFSKFLIFLEFLNNPIISINICMLHIVLLHYVNHLYLLASCKGLICISKPSSALGKTLFLLIMFLSTFDCLSCTINCVYSFIHSFIHSFIPFCVLLSFARSVKMGVCD